MDQETSDRGKQEAFRACRPSFYDYYLQDTGGHASLASPGSDIKVRIKVEAADPEVSRM